MLYENEIVLGDCLDVLKQLPDNSIDSVVTDPPYGLGTREPTVEDIIHYLRGERLDTGGDFMGKEWDIPSVAIWKECFRILKPGGHLLSFGGCYDEHTEVLTRKGWVKFPDVMGEEEFASLDLSSHKIEWQKAKEVVRQRHDGPMYYYRTSKIDLLVTPNHNMLVATLGPGKDFRLQRADSHGRAIRMTKTSRGRSDVTDPGVFRLPPVQQLISHGHEKTLEEKVIPLEAWLPFFGLWLAEGSASITKADGGHGYKAAICHFDLENLREIQRRLADWFDVKIYPEQGKLHIHSKQLVVYLRQFGKAWEKFLPDWVKQLSAQHLKVLWDWYMRGDGWAHQRGYTSSPRLRDDWQEVALYMGISADWSVTRPGKFSWIEGRLVQARRPHYVLRFNHTQSQPEIYDRRDKRHPVRTVVPAEDWNNQMVYCVELPKHHTLYVRRNGKAVWCGNTRTWDLISIGLRAAGFENRDTIAEDHPGLQWKHGQGFPKSLNIGKSIDKLKGAEREIVGHREGGFGNKPGNEGGGEDETALWLNKAPTTKEVRENASSVVPITAPVTPEASEWEGWGTALKPSWEPILVFRKPVEGTITENVLQHGTGGINIEGTRVKHASPEDFEKHKAMVDRLKEQGGSLGDSWKNSSDLSGANDVKTAGRWPPNALMVHSRYEWYSIKPEISSIRAIQQAVFAYYSIEQALCSMQKVILGDTLNLEEAEILFKALCEHQPQGGQKVSLETDDMSALLQAIRSARGLGKGRQTEVLLKTMPVSGYRRSTEEEQDRQEAYYGSQDQDEGRSHREIPKGKFVPMEGWAYHFCDGLRVRYGHYLVSEGAGTSESDAKGELQPDVHFGTQNRDGDPPRTTFTENGNRASPERGQGRQSVGEPTDNGSKESQYTTPPGRGGTSGSTRRSSQASRGELRVEVARHLIPSGWQQFFELSAVEGCKRVGTKKVKQRPISWDGGVMTTTSPSLGRMASHDQAVSQNRGSSVEEEVESWECADGCPVRALDEQTGDRPSTLTGRADPSIQHVNPGDNHGASWFGGGNSNVYADGGGASRFFPQFEGQVPPEAPFLYTGKATKREATIDGQVPNRHPTKKPLALMQWLVRLVTPKKGICLDPFCGSGTTCVAAVEEGMRFIGIEKDPGFYPDTVKRVEFVLQREQEDQDQRDMFDELMNG